MTSRYVNKSYLEKLEIFPKNSINFRNGGNKKEPPFCLLGWLSKIFSGGCYRCRTYDLFRVKEALSR